MYDTVPKFARRLSTVTPSVRTGVSRRIAELRVRLRKRVASPRKLISRLGVAVTCITVVAPPALLRVISTNQLRQHALEQASIGARHIEVQTQQKGNRRLARTSFDQCLARDAGRQELHHRKLGDRHEAHR